jgi:hypothetical protein
MARGDFLGGRFKVTLQTAVVPKLEVSQRMIRPLIAVTMCLTTINHAAASARFDDVLDPSPAGGASHRAEADTPNTMPN